jgi:hypothetical protein
MIDRKRVFDFVLRNGVDLRVQESSELAGWHQRGEPWSRPPLRRCAALPLLISV